MIIRAQEKNKLIFSENLFCLNIVKNNDEFSIIAKSTNGCEEVLARYKNITEAKLVLDSFINAYGKEFKDFM